MVTQGTASARPPGCNAGLDVQRSDPGNVADAQSMLKNAIESRTFTYVGVQVPINGGSHWVGVDGSPVEFDGVRYLKVSPTSDNDLNPLSSVRQNAAWHFETINGKTTAYVRQDSVTGTVTATPSDPSNPTSGSGTEQPPSVICHELYRQGLMDEVIHQADQKFGYFMKNHLVLVVDGYQFWAKPIVKVMQRSKSVTKLVNCLAKPWAKEMAYRMGAIPKGDIIGAVIMGIGVPMCGLIGFLIQPNCWLILGILFLGCVFIVRILHQFMRRNIA